MNSYLFTCGIYINVTYFILKNTHWPHVSSACKLLPDVVCNLCLCSLYWGTVHWHYVSRGLVSYYLVLCVFCYMCVVSVCCMCVCLHVYLYDFYFILGNSPLALSVEGL